MQVLISIGSNHNSLQNVEEALRLLSHLLIDACATKIIATAPFGAQYKNDFHNCLISGSTSLSVTVLESILKRIEQKMGRTPDSKLTGIVPIDIDILQYGDDKYHLRDWQRPYVTNLLSSSFSPLITPSFTKPGFI